MGIVTAASIEQATGELAASSPPVVVIPVHRVNDDVIRGHDAIFRHTPSDVPVLVIDDTGSDPRVLTSLEGSGAPLHGHVVMLRLSERLGPVRACNVAFGIAKPHDVVIVSSDVIVGPEWFERLRAAATSDTTVASASTLTNDGTLLSVPSRNRLTQGLAPGASIDDAARRIAAGSARRYPTIPTAIGHCTYLRRDALELVGEFDDACSPGGDETTDWSQRAIGHGLRHVCADDVLTFRPGVDGSDRTPEAKKNRGLIDARYRYYPRWAGCAATDVASPLADVIGNAERALSGFSVGIDATILDGPPLGTQRVTVETIKALAALPDISEIHVFGPSRLPGYASTTFEALGKVHVHQVDRRARLRPRLRRPVVDVMYRPYQVQHDTELDWLRTVGRRLIVNQLDMIAFNNASYFGSANAWLAYRATGRRMGAIADGVAFISNHGRAAAQQEGLVTAGTPTRVVSCGIDHMSLDRAEIPTPPSDSLEPGFLLCIGTSFTHKNRPFAIKVWRELRRRGWPGELVLAGPTPPFGNSIAAEAALASNDPEIASGVVTLASVTEAEKRWLYQHASLVLYPTTTEGFGLIPFEAAAMGTPTLSSRRGSLAETLPPSIPVLDTWDVHHAADLAAQLLDDQQLAEQLCTTLREHAEHYTWERTANELLGFMREVAIGPARRVAEIRGECAWEDGPTSDDNDVSRQLASGTPGLLDRAARLVMSRLKRS